MKTSSAIFLFAVSLAAQDTRAVLEGQALDPSGAIAAGSDLLDIGSNAIGNAVTGRELADLP